MIAESSKIKQVKAPRNAPWLYQALIFNYLVLFMAFSPFNRHLPGSRYCDSSNPEDNIIIDAPDTAKEFGIMMMMSVGGAIFSSSGGGDYNILIAEVPRKISGGARAAYGDKDIIQLALNHSLTPYTLGEKGSQWIYGEMGVLEEQSTWPLIVVAILLVSIVFLLIKQTSWAVVSVLASLICLYIVIPITSTIKMKHMYDTASHNPPYPIVMCGNPTSVNDTLAAAHIIADTWQTDTWLLKLQCILMTIFFIMRTTSPIRIFKILCGKEMRQYEFETIEISERGLWDIIKSCNCTELREYISENWCKMFTISGFGKFLTYLSTILLFHLLAKYIFDANRRSILAIVSMAFCNSDNLITAYLVIPMTIFVFVAQRHIDNIEPLSEPEEEALRLQRGDYGSV